MNCSVFALFTFQLSINIKYLYLTPSSTSQITILLDESKVEALTGWLAVNNGEIVRVDKPRKKNSTPGKFFFLSVICHGMAVFILDDASYPSGRTWANIRYLSGYSSLV